MEGLRFICGPRTKIPQAAQHGKKKKKKNCANKFENLDQRDIMENTQPSINYSR